MTNATERGRARPGESTAGFFVLDGESGRQAGAAWAAESAEYHELRRLAGIAEGGGLDDDQAGYRVVSAIRGERYLSREEIAAFRETFGFEDDNARIHSREYWQGFVQGALEVFAGFEM